MCGIGQAMLMQSATRVIVDAPMGGARVDCAPRRAVRLGSYMLLALSCRPLSCAAWRDFRRRRTGYYEQLDGDHAPSIQCHGRAQLRVNNSLQGGCLGGSGPLSRRTCAATPSRRGSQQQQLQHECSMLLVVFVLVGQRRRSRSCRGR